MNKLVFFILLTLFPFTTRAEEWTDPATNVIYTYDPAGTTASVKASSGGIGCPDAKGDIVIADEIEVDGKRYRVTSIGTYAFSNNTAITSIYVPESVTSIGQGAFADCKNLTTIRLSKNITHIESFLFWSCHKLTAIEIPEGVTDIDHDAFNGCHALTELHIPASVKNISDESFIGTSGIQRITVAADNPVYDSRQDCNAIIVTKENKIFKACDNTFIPADIVSIGRLSFGNYRPSSLILPDGLTTIEEAAFGGIGPESIFIPASVTSIGEEGFYFSSGLRTVTFDPACAVKEIKTRTFGCCNNLTTVFLPAGLTTVGVEAFYKSENLKEIHFLNEEPPTAYHQAFTSVNWECIAYVPIGSVEKYQNNLSNYWLDNFAEDSETATITVNSKLSTYTPLLPLDFSEVECITPYIIESFNAERGLLMAKKVTKVPPRTGLLLLAETPGDFIVPVDWETEAIKNNMLVGNIKRRKIPARDYVNTDEYKGYVRQFILARGSHGVGFYPSKDYPSSNGELAKGKAFLRIPEQMFDDAEVKSLSLLFEDGTTGLQAEQQTADNEKGNEMYDLSGRRVKIPASGHGFYIRKGKKMVIH